MSPAEPMLIRTGKLTVAPKATPSNIDPPDSVPTSKSYTSGSKLAFTESTELGSVSSLLLEMTPEAQVADAVNNTG